MSAKRGLGIAIVVGLGCSSPNIDPAPPIEQVPIEPRVVNGTPSPASQDSVVMVLTAQQMCSGTLITPNLVLTARHCVANLNQQTGEILGDLSPSELYIGTGASQTPQNPNIVGQGVKIFDDGSTSLESHDVALIQLDKDVQGALTSNVRQAAATPGELVTVVGFGEDGSPSGQLTPGRYQRSGIKILAIGPKQYTFVSKSGQSQSVDVPSGTICTGESACHGDSGGPIFDAQGQVVGVVSGAGGMIDTCIDAPAFFSDVTSHYTMIAQAAASAGHPLSSSAGVDAGAPDAASSGFDASAPADAGSPSVPDSGSGKSPSPSSQDASSNGGAPNNDPGLTGGSTISSSSGCNAGGHAPDASFALAALGFAYGVRRRRSRR